MKGFGNQAKPKKKLNNYLTVQNHKQIFHEAIKKHSAGNFSEALKKYQYLIKSGFEDSRVFNNYGMILINLGKLNEAELLIRKAIDLNPKDATGYSNLGAILKGFGKLTEAELLIRKAIDLNPKDTAAYSNLGGILKNIGRHKEALLFLNKAIELNPNFADAHHNLANTLLELENLKKAELSARKAIKIKPNFANAYLCLGIILRDLGKFEEAESSTLKAIQLGSNDLAICYRNLSLLLYKKGNFKEALRNIEEAYSFDPEDKDNQLLRSVLKTRNNTKFRKISAHVNTQINKGNSFPIILNKKIDQELIKALYKIKTVDLNKFRDPSTGYARGSDYNLFVDNEEITKKLEKDLIKITKELVDSDVFFRDSFFTILEGKSTIIKHNHLGSLDKFVNLNLWKQKYSLVYYLSIGDQNCQHPGILKFYKDEFDDNANKEVLPSEGMMVIFPADTYHSVKYDGKKDRIIIGVNFYSI